MRLNLRDHVDYVFRLWDRICWFGSFYLVGVGLVTGLIWNQKSPDGEAYAAAANASQLSDWLDSIDPKHMVAAAFLFLSLFVVIGMTRCYLYLYAVYWDIQNGKVKIDPNDRRLMAFSVLRIDHTLLEYGLTMIAVISATTALNCYMTENIPWALVSGLSLLATAVVMYMTWTGKVKYARSPRA